MKSLKRKIDEKGFTLLEVLVVISIVGAITGVMTMTLTLMNRVTPQTNNQSIALRQVQNAGYWISRDVRMAETVSPDNDPATPLFLTLQLPLTADTVKTVIYELENVDGAIKRLMRTDQDTGLTTLIADDIYYDPNGDPGNSTDEDYDDVNRILTMTVTAVSGEEMVSRQYEAMQRVAENES